MNNSTIMSILSQIEKTFDGVEKMVKPIEGSETTLTQEGEYIGTINTYNKSVSFVEDLRQDPAIGPLGDYLKKSGYEHNLK